MARRRVAEPYPINDGHRIRMVVRHRLIGGPHVGTHRPTTRPRPFTTHRRHVPRPIYVIMIGLAAIPLIVVMTIPARLLPNPYPIPGIVPGVNQNDQRTVPNEAPQRAPERATPPPRVNPRPTPTRSPPRTTKPPQPKATTAPPSKTPSPAPTCPPSAGAAGLVPESPLPIPPAVESHVKETINEPFNDLRP